MSEPASASRVTFPLALLFLVVTGAAILAAVVAPAIREMNFEDLLEAPLQTGAGFGAAFLGGVVLGAILGLFQFHRSTGVLVGVAVGGFLGPIAFVLSQVGAELVVVMVPAVLIGCVILLVVAWFIRPPVQSIEGDPVRATINDDSTSGTK